MTEVERSCGDFEHPAEDDDFEFMDQRDFSPDVRDVPIDLRNLDKNDYDLEVQSIRSVRLYMGASPKRKKATTRRIGGGQKNSNLGVVSKGAVKFLPIK